jgi:aminopeptidase N
VAFILAFVSTSLSSSVEWTIHEMAMADHARGDLAILDDPPLYEIKVEIDPAKLNFKGHMQVVITNNEGVTLREIYLRLYPNGQKIYGRNALLEVTEVRMEGQQVQPTLEVEGTALRVPLPRPLAPEESVVMSLSFEGTVPEDFEGGYGIYNYAEGVMCLANWYPILAVFDEEGWNLDPVLGWGDAVYSDIGLYEVMITVPSTTVVVASGTKIETISIGNEGKATHFYVSGPMRDFFIILGEFEVKSEVVGETVVNSYFKTKGEKALLIASKALEIFNLRFGAYPYVELDIVEAPLFFAGGVEYPGIILISEKLYSSQEIWFDIVISHEVAHQWWYNVVGNDVIDEPWLDEALATYSSAIYIEEALGKEQFKETLGSWRMAYRQAKAQVKPGVTITSSLYEFPQWRGYTPIVYFGGALFYQALREEIGDEAFYESLKSYYQRFKYRIASTLELLEVFEETSGKHLGELYEKWLF